MSVYRIIEHVYQDAEKDPHNYGDKFYTIQKKRGKVSFFIYKFIPLVDPEWQDVIDEYSVKGTGPLQFSSVKLAKLAIAKLKKGETLKGWSEKVVLETK